MAIRPKFDYVVKKSSFKNVYSRIDAIHSQVSVDFINSAVRGAKFQDPFDCLVSIQSLEGLTEDLIDSLDPSIQYIQVKSWQHRMLESLGKEKKTVWYASNNVVFESAEDYQESSCIYTREELKQIIKKIEQIEKGTENLDLITKIATIHNRLKRHISYDHKTDSTASLHTRSMRGLISGKSVCAGYAMILQLILQRQGVDCKFVGGFGHAWNLVEIDKKYYVIDLTENAKLYHWGKRGLDSMKYFLRNGAEFRAENPAKSMVGAADYNDLHDRDDKEIKKALRYEEMDSHFSKGKDVSIMTRKDGTQFYVAEVGYSELDDSSKQKPVIVYKYIYIPVKNNKASMADAQIIHSTDSVSSFLDKIEYYSDNEPDQDRVQALNKALDCFVNEVMSVKNLEKTTQIDGGSFVGGIKVVGRKDGIPQACEFDEQEKYQSYYKPEEIRMVNDKMIEKRYNGSIYRYDCYTMNPDLSIDKRSIFSESDLLILPQFDLERVFDQEKMEEVIFNDGGYFGELDQNGVIVKNPTTLQHYREAVGIKIKQ